MNSCFFVGTSWQPCFEKKKELLAIFQLEIAQEAHQKFVGKKVAFPVDYPSLEQFEVHLKSVLKRIDPTQVFQLVLFPSI